MNAESNPPARRALQSAAIAAASLGALGATYADIARLFKGPPHWRETQTPEQAAFYKARAEAKRARRGLRNLQELTARASGETYAAIEARGGNRNSDEVRAEYEARIKRALILPVPV